TSISAIPELIIEGETGLLVPERDSPALAKALDMLIRNPESRQKFALAGEQRVRSEFALRGAINDLARRFGLDEPTPDPDKIA
ncbi:MAG: glycosyltransferase, partial [Rhodospirillales bacterium]